MSYFTTPQEVVSYLESEVEVLSNTMSFGRVDNYNICPKNGVKNHSRDKSKPLYYDGIKMNIRFKCGYDTDLDKIFTVNNLHLITGGPVTNPNGKGIVTYNYICRFFIDDFPKMKSRVEEIRIMKSLNGEQPVVSMDDFKRFC